MSRNPMLHGPVSPDSASHGSVSRIRCFVGLPLPDEYGQLLDVVRREWGEKLSSRISWTRKGNEHLTLKFLGGVDESAIPGLCAAFEGIAFEPFLLQAGPGGFFLSRGAVRVAWVGLAKGAREAALLGQAVDRAVAPLGFEPQRTTTPHLTVARIRKAERDPWDAFAVALGDIRWPCATVANFVLWQSLPGPNGPAYSPLRTFSASRTSLEES